MGLPMQLELKAQRLGYLFFFVSGAAALLYELIWVRLLGFVFGNTTHAVSTVLTVYMSGLGLGSYWLGRRADRWRRPLRAYGVMEIGIGAYAALTFLLLGGIQALAVGFAHRFDPGPALFSIVRLGLSFLILFPPTFLMGATLPTLAKFYIRRTEGIGSGTALLYGLNTAGAVAGTLTAGFLLLPVLGMRDTLRMAVVLNLGIGTLACLLSQQLRAAGLEPSAPTEELTLTSRSIWPRPSSSSQAWLPAGLAISGALAMAYEVSWTRVLATVLGSSTYAFTLMLATFLLGIALGSGIYERILRRRPARMSDWAGLQIGIALFALGTLPLFDRVGILTVRLFSLTLGHPLWLEGMRFGVCGLLMIVPTLCFGALFPVSASLYTQDPSVIGRRLGTLYLANTVGNVLGSLGTGFLLIPMIGLYRTFLAAIGLGGALGIAVALAHRPSSRRALAVWGAAAFLLGGGLFLARGGWSQRLITAGLHVKPFEGLGLDSGQIQAMLHDREMIFYREGSSSVVSVEQGAHRALRVNGKVDASSGRDMETQVLSAHLPHLLHPDPARTLVIGFGSGTTLRCSLAHPIRQADCVEIEPAVLEAAPYFDEINHRAYSDPRARLILNDGRNHLLMEQEAYDLIISEPSNPWIAGTATLFTVEFYELARRRLKTGGILCQWLQAYALEPADFAMVVRSIQKVFPHVTIWMTLSVDFLIIASDQPIVFDLDRIRERIDRSPELKEDLLQLGIPSAPGLLASFQLGEKDVKTYTQGNQLNTDDQLLLEFNAPWALYKNTDPLIHEALNAFRTQPLPTIARQGSDPLEDPKILVEIGQGSLAKNFAPVAQGYFERALQRSPNLPEALVGLGRCYLAGDRLLAAIDLFRKAAAADPKSAYAYGNLGWALLKGGDLTAALDALRKAAQLDPQDWDTRIREGMTLEKLQRWEEAAEAYRQGLSLNPNYWPLRFNYARTLVRAKQAAQALPLLEMLHQERRTVRAITLELAAAYEQLGQMDRAEATFEELVRLNRFRPENWRMLAHFYNRQGNRSKAVAAFLRAYELNPLPG